MVKHREHQTLTRLHQPVKALMSQANVSIRYNTSSHRPAYGMTSGPSRLKAPVIAIVDLSKNDSIRCEI